MGQLATESLAEQHDVVEGRGSGTWQSPQCTGKGAVRERAPRVRAEWAMWGASRESFLLVFAQRLCCEHRHRSEMVRTLFCARRGPSAPLLCSSGPCPFSSAAGPRVWRLPFRAPFPRVRLVSYRRRVSLGQGAHPRFLFPQGHRVPGTRSALVGYVLIALRLLTFFG